MDEWFEFSYEGLIAIVISAIGIYVSVIIMTRICGKRSFSKMSSFDFAMTVAVGSIIATTILSKSVSLIYGIVGNIAVYLLQIGAAYIRRNDVVKKLMDNELLLLMDGPIILEDNLRKGRVAKSDLRAKLREANVTELSEVKAVIFETTGDISVLHKKHDRSIEDFILEDVARS
ncbi:MAG: YetF domain-containing protein [Maribacter sp.]